MELKRDRVSSLYLAGKPQVAIVIALQYLNVNNSFCAIARYHGTGIVARRQGSEWNKTLKRTLVILSSIITNLI